MSAPSPDQDFPVDPTRVIQRLSQRLAEETLQVVKLEAIITQMVVEKAEAEQAVGAAQVGEPPAA